MNPSSAPQFTPPMCPFNNCPSSLRWWIWSARQPPRNSPPPPPTAVYKTGFLINVASWESNCHLPVMKINVARCFEERQVFLNHLCMLEAATAKSTVTYDLKKKKKGIWIVCVVFAFIQTNLICWKYKHDDIDLWLEMIFKSYILEKHYCKNVCKSLSSAFKAAALDLVDDVPAHPHLLPIVSDKQDYGSIHFFSLSCWSEDVLQKRGKNKL